VKHFVLIEMADVELVGVQTFHNRTRAMERFEEVAIENRVHPVGASDLAREIDGTIAFAGDDAYSVTVIESDGE
jgi:hypothetical protein